MKKKIILNFLSCIFLNANEFIISSTTQIQNAQVVFDKVHISSVIQKSNANYDFKCDVKVEFITDIPTSLNMNKQKILNCIKYNDVLVNAKEVIYKNELFESTNTISFSPIRFKVIRNKNYVEIFTK